MVQSFNPCPDTVCPETFLIGARKLKCTFENWSLIGAEAYQTASWDLDGTMINFGVAKKATVTLKVDGYIEGISSSDSKVLVDAIG
jgi:hypothetical protein